MIIRHTVSQEEGGTALLHILRRSMGLSGTAVKRLKTYGGLRVDGEERYTNYAVSPGQVVTADVSIAEAEGDSRPEEGPLDILYEDEGLIAVNKPPGLLVHPSRARYTGTLSNFVAGYLAGRGERPVCHAANRLDRDTSGVVIFAKNAHVKALLTPALGEGTKQYTAVVCGVLRPLRGVIDLPIRRLRERDMRRVVDPGGQRAVTHYSTVGAGELSGEPYSVLEIALETGRTHQIRVHCLAREAPLLGDSLYCTDRSRALSRRAGAGRQLLHSGRVVFCHPLTGRELDLRAPIGDGVMLGLVHRAEPYFL